MGGSTRELIEALCAHAQVTRNPWRRVRKGKGKGKVVVLVVCLGLGEAPHHDSSRVLHRVALARGQPGLTA